jgi:hypothetical protein
MEKKKFFIALSRPSAGRDNLPALTSPTHRGGVFLNVRFWPKADTQAVARYSVTAWFMIVSINNKEGV